MCKQFYFNNDYIHIEVRVIPLTTTLHKIIHDFRLESVWSVFTRGTNFEEALDACVLIENLCYCHRLHKLDKAYRKITMQSESTVSLKLRSTILFLTEIESWWNNQHQYLIPPQSECDIGNWLFICKLELSECKCT